MRIFVHNFKESVLLLIEAATTNSTVELDSTLLWVFRILSMVQNLPLYVTRSEECRLLTYTLTKHHPAAHSRDGVGRRLRRFPVILPQRRPERMEIVRNVKSLTVHQQHESIRSTVCGAPYLAADS